MILPDHHNPKMEVQCVDGGSDGGNSYGDFHVYLLRGCVTFQNTSLLCRNTAKCL